MLVINIIFTTLPRGLSLAISAGRVSLPDNGKSCGGRPGPSAAVTSLSVESSAADNGQECLLIRFKRNKKKKERSQREKCQNSQPVTAATNGTADNCYATCNLVAAAHPQLMVRRVEFEFWFFLLLPPFRPASGEEFSRVDTRR